MYNADVLLGRLITATFGAAARLAPVLKHVDRLSAARAASAPGSRSRCSRSSSSRSSSVRSRPARSSTASTTSTTFGGGFDVRATTSPASPIRDMRAALAHAPGRARRRHPRRLEPVAAARSTPTRSARRAGPSPTSSTAPTARSSSTRRIAFAATAHGLRARAADVWHALRRIPSLAVVDSLVVPRKSNFNFGATSEVQAPGLLPRGQDVHARSASTCATRRPAGACR